MTEQRLDGRVERGNRTRRLVLRRTVAIASLEGLDSLSLGRLSTELKLSKSGVFALFGSKEELQPATVRAASRIYLDEVVTPALAHSPGPLRDALGAADTEWRALVRQTITGARDAGEFAPDTDAAQLAFELIAFWEAANLQSILMDSDEPYGRAPTAVRNVLRAVSAAETDFATTPAAG